MGVFRVTTVIFDTETTGLIKPDECDINAQPSIIEIYLLKLDDNLVKIDDFETLIKPPVPITEEITRITRIDNNDVRNSPSFIKIFDSLAKFMTGVDTLVAHNLAFDRAMLANELVRINKILRFPWPREHICTVEKTMHIEQRRLTLTNLHKNLFGEAFEDAHRAKSDVDALYRCYKELITTRMI